MIYMIDHYDSFTFNIVQYLGELGHEVIVSRNDEVTIAEIETLEPELIFLSPGPRTPKETGMTLEVMEKFKGVIPIFGVCLGHQAIAYCHGSEIVKAGRLMHGKTSELRHSGEGIFSGVSQDAAVMNYHSLVVSKETLSDEWVITAENHDGEVMGIRHRTLPLEGIQFHPESIGTPEGRKILSNVVEQLKINI